MAARKRTWTPEVVRQRIRAAMITNRLHKFIAGEIQMSAAQVTASLGLLKKSVPDLQSVEFTGEMRHTHASDLTDEQLAAIAARALATGSGAGIAEAQTSPDEPPELH